MRKIERVGARLILVQRTEVCWSPGAGGCLQRPSGVSTGEESVSKDSSLCGHVVQNYCMINESAGFEDEE